MSPYINLIDLLVVLVFLPMAVLLTVAPLYGARDDLELLNEVSPERRLSSCGHLTRGDDESPDR
jgi:hypothetical protein